MGVRWRELEVRRERGKRDPRSVGTSQEIGLVRGGSRMLLSLTTKVTMRSRKAILVATSLAIVVSGWRHLRALPEIEGLPGKISGQLDGAAS